MKIKIPIMALVGIVIVLFGLTIPANASYGVVVPKTHLSDLSANTAATTTLYLPIITNQYIVPSCRLGATLLVRPISVYDPKNGYHIATQPGHSLAPVASYLPSLRLGWYMNFGTSMSPERPNGIRFAQTVFVKQYKLNQSGQKVLYDVRPDGSSVYSNPPEYFLSPDLATIQTMATKNPGSLWLVGNEIERRDWLNSDGTATGQDEILPDVYADAYNAVYTAIKAVDPTALVSNGSVIVPTPLRLQYLTSMWDAYQNKYHSSMPVDVWQIHVYLAPEKFNSWGIGIPAGINNVDTGMFYWGPNDPRNVLVNKDFSYVPNLVANFRSWLKARGQQNKPLVLSEFGVSMPNWASPPGYPNSFTPEQVRDSFMYPGLDYVLNQTDSNLGYPADSYRMVQSTWWWSLDYDSGQYDLGVFYPYFNGNLLWSGIGAPTNAPYPKGYSQLGNYWINKIASLSLNNPPGLLCGQ